MDAVSDRHIGDAATSSDAWAQWLASRADRRAITLEGLLPATARLVVVAPHPDDELLTCGGLMQLHAAHGGRVTVIVVTDGEASHGPASDHSRATLGSQRRAESDAGLARLGLPAAAAVRLHLPDGGLRERRNELAGALESLVDEADVVVSTWRLDGHPDHEAVGELSQQIAQRTGAGYAAAPVWMWHWAAPEDRRIPWQDLRGLRLDHAVVAHKLAALAEHRSQFMTRGGASPAVLDPPILQRAAWFTEYFFV